MEMTLSRMRQLERASLLAALSLLTLLAWWYLVHPPHLALGGASGAIAVNAAMWSVMMVAMMLPSASPMILTYSRIRQSRSGRGKATAPAWLFTSGYLLVWTGFAVAAAIAQWALYQSQLLSSGMGHVGLLPGGALLVLAGAFQFSPLKQACLDQCRSPIGFIMTEWREGATGTLVMGMRLGAFCTGCCWALMLLMFVGGVMSLAWMAALAVFFLAEKLLPLALSRRLRYISGIPLVAGGTLMMASAVL
ncbi:DUF2182 domain-containing protein [Marinobacter zhanjiangensis]|uniref:Metal-binding membrane protein n=1 Tax=Marinobacter zhanjiangensis TaxID=578215 RepID=A0ABQ3ANF3_9GAMM|nr:DUF2182 domain-containing protein [Marinobacter zhanjiangensis]GGY62096.1 hypothetical protein GCM10007071_06210 [Marinobacter zhanjiangensis]